MGVHAHHCRRALAVGVCTLSAILLVGCNTGSAGRSWPSDAAGALVYLVVHGVAIPCGSDDPYRDRRVLDHPELVQHELDPWP